MGDRYVLSVWKNHGDASKWLFDICDERSYFRNSFFYLKRYKKPYYYTPLYIGMLVPLLLGSYQQSYERYLLTIYLLP